MLKGSGDYDMDHSSGDEVKLKKTVIDKFTVDVISAGDVVKYTVPSFNVITVDLKHVVASVWDDEQTKISHYDMLLQNSSDIDTKVPCTVEIANSCYIQVSEFAGSVGGKYHFPPAGVLVVWRWNWLKPEEECQGVSSDDYAGTTEEESDSGSAAEVERSAPLHALTFKCIGATKNRDYQMALQTVRDLIHAGREVSVSLFHELTNPRNARALAFVCRVDKKDCTIGYVVSDVLEEVHSAINDGSILSVKIAWVRYITDWSRSGPGFFAGIRIEKRGHWSSNVVQFASTR